MNNFRLHLSLIAITTLLPVFSYAQQSVGIGTNSPNPRAVLQLVSPGQNQGFLLPKLTTTEINTMPVVASDRGLMVYDSLTNEIKYWSGTLWISLGSGGATSLNSLSDVTLTAPAIGNYLRYNGVDWVNSSTIFPINETVAAAGTQFQLNQTGPGTTFRLTNSSPLSTDFVMSVEAFGDAIAGYFVKNNPASTNQAFYSHTLGTGPALVSFGLGNSSTAARFANTSISSTQPSVIIENAGTGLGLNVVTGGVRINQLAGTGTRMVVANATGTLSTAAIPASQWLNTGSDIYFNGGNVGIGVASPLTRFHVFQTANQATFFETDATVQAQNYLEFSTGRYNSNTNRLDAKWQVGLNQNPTPSANDFFGIGRNNIGYDFTVNRSGFVAIGPSHIATEILDVAGNVKFSGALMPNNTAGTAGQVLTSAGAGLPPTWAAAGGGWGLTGNTGTNSSTNFIGTSDFQSLNFRTNNIRRMTIDTVGRIFKGGSPLTGLLVEELLTRENQPAANGVVTFSNIPSHSPRFNVIRSRGTELTPSAILNNDWIGSYGFIGFNGTNYRNAGSIFMDAGENWTGSANGAFMSFNTVSNGSILSTERMRIHSNGYIGIGTTNPKSRLQIGNRMSFVNGNIGTLDAITRNIYLDATDTPRYVSAGTANALLMEDGRTELGVFAAGAADGFILGPQTNIEITPTGVGINRTPNEVLDVEGPVRLSQIGVPGTIVDRLYNVGGSLFWNGTNISAGSSGWSLTGNAGTNPITEYMGTSDATALSIRTSAIERMGINPTGQVYVGSSLPSGAAGDFQVNKETFSTIANGAYGNVFNISPRYQARRARGTFAAPSAILNDDWIGSFSFRGYDGIAFADGGGIAMDAGENWSSTNHGTYMPFFTVINGQSAAAERMRIHSNGFVGIGTLSPTERLDITGNFRFSGALMPNNTAGTAGQVLTSAGVGLPPIWAAAGGTGTVTSVALLLPSIFTVSGSPVTTTGTLTGSLANQTANTIFAGPTTGVPGTPSFRTMVANDVPNLDAAIITTGTFPIARGGTNGTATPTAGAVAYGTGTAYAFTAAGTSGQLLQSNGAGVPTWVNAPAAITASNGLTRTVNDIALGGPLTANTSIASAGFNLSLTGTGRLGVGTAAPNATFNIDHQSNTGRDAFNIINSRDNVGSATPFYIGGVTAGQTYGVNTFGRLMRLENTTQVALADIGIDGSGRFYITRSGAFDPNTDFAISATGLIGIGKNAATERLDVAGNVRFSGALMPNNLAGTSGQVLTSAGAGAPPTWTNPSAFGWSLLGNAGTVDGTNFIGTSDLVPLTFRVNNLPSGRININGSTFFGYQSGTTNTAVSNTGFGLRALQSVTTGDFNTAFGNQALAQNTSQRNTAVGNNALGANTTGSGNTAVGDRAMNANSNGTQNVGVGLTALFSNVGSNFNVAIGYDALFSTTGGSNTGLGHRAGFTNTAGFSNTFIGENADASVNNLTNATAIGADAVVSQSNSVVLGNIANVGIGTSSPSERLDVTGNVRFSGALMPNNLAGTSGQVLTSAGAGTPPTWANPSSFGWSLLGNAGTVDGTNFIGSTDAIPFTIRTNNIRSARLEPGANGNAFFGFEAGLSVPNNSTSTAIGYQALRTAATGSQNTAIGFRALNVANGAIQNVAVGMNAMVANTTGSQNTGVGYGVMSANLDGLRNVAVGMNALNANTTGDDNVSIGYQSLLSNVGGNFNVGIGSQALQNTTGGSNVAIGVGSGAFNTSGTNNTFLGSGANATVNNLTNATAIGANANVSQSNTLILGNGANVGIGTSTPARRLHVVDPSTLGMVIEGTNTIGTILDLLTLGNGATGVNDPATRGWQYLAYGNAFGTASLQNDMTLRAYNGTASTDVMHWEANGNIGIGTQSPTAQLHTTGGVRFAAFTGPGVLTVDASGNVGSASGSAVVGSGLINRVTYWATGSSIGASSNFYWDNTTENLGVGWPSPERNLHLHRASGADVLSKYTNTNTFVGAGNGFEVGILAAGDAILRNMEPTSMQFHTSNTERMRISAAGNVGIGAIPNVDYAVDVTSPQRHGLRLNSTFTGTGPSYGIYNIQNTVLTGTRYAIFNDVDIPSGSTTSYGVLNSITDAGTGINYGVTNSIFSNGTIFGTQNVLTAGATSTATQYGMYTQFQNSGTGTTYGDYVRIFNNGTGPRYGNYVLVEAGASNTSPIFGVNNDITPSGSGNVFGVSNSISGVGTGVRYGFYNQLLAAAGNSSQIYGYHNVITPSGTGTVNGYNNLILAVGTGIRYGLFNSISAGASNGSIIYGTYNSLSAGGTGGAIGDYSTISSVATTTGELYGSRYDISPEGTGLVMGSRTTILAGAGTGARYGYYSSIGVAAANPSAIYGLHSFIAPGGTGTTIGTYNRISSTGTGERYGTYNDVSASSTNTSPIYGLHSLTNHSGSGTVYGSFIDANKPALQSGTVYGQYVISDNDGTGDSYLMYANSIGATTGIEYGLYVTGEDRNYFSNNVGIGTTTPNAPLQFSNGLANRKIVLWEGFNNDHQYYGFGINGSTLRYQVDATIANHVFFAATSATTSNELMRITGFGDVGIGTNTPLQKLHIYDAADPVLRLTSGTTASLTNLANSGAIDFLENNGVWGTNASGFRVGYDGSANNFYVRSEAGSTTITDHFIIDRGANRIGIARNPTLNAFEVEGNASKTTAGGFIANSDARIKTEIQDIEGSIETLLSLRPVKFKYTNQYKALHPSIEDRFYHGFIAQEYQKVFPELVKLSGDTIPGTSERILQIEPYDAQIITMKAVQEQQAQIEALKKEIEELKALLRKDK
jgi:hypothetical protein